MNLFDYVAKMDEAEARAIARNYAETFRAGKPIEAGSPRAGALSASDIHETFWSAQAQGLMAEIAVKFLCEIALEAQTPAHTMTPQQAFLQVAEYLEASAARKAMSLGEVPSTPVTLERARKRETEALQAFCALDVRQLRSFAAQNKGEQ